MKISGTLYRFLGLKNKPTNQITKAIIRTKRISKCDIPNKPWNLWKQQLIQ